MKVSISDVARAAGVSIKTVSRVSNGEAGVATATRDKVKQAIAQLGYSPDPAARSMRSGRTHSIGMPLPLFPSTFTSLLHLGALRACGELGYTLVNVACESDPKLAIKSLQQLVTKARVDAILLSVPFINLPEIYRWLAKRKLPFASVARPIIDAESDYSFAENEQASRALTEHLISLGHRRIALLRGLPTFPATTEREAGFRSACLAHSIEIADEYVIDGDFSHEAGVEAGRRLLSMIKPPTAVVCCSDNMAIGLMHAAHEIGISIPSQLSVTGFDNSNESRYAFPPLTTANQPVEDMAYAAVHSLITRIRRPAAASHAQGFECELIIRETTAPPSSL